MDSLEPKPFPKGIGLTSTTVKHRTDGQNRSVLARTIEGIHELKGSNTEETMICTSYRPTSKTPEGSVFNRNGDHHYTSEARAVESGMMSCYVETSADVQDAKDNCDQVCMDELRSPSPETNTDDETEADTICASHVLDQTVTPNSKSIPRDFVDSAPRDQPSVTYGVIFTTISKPVENNTILIPHKYQTDTPLGDYLGATLSTYERKSGGSYKYQHLLKDIKDGYPAKTMRIGEGDELVLICEKFTPDLNHTAVLNIFHHDVKVDGKTRFCLVLRRSEKPGKKRPWYWYETSAILSPKGHCKDIAPEVLTPRYDTINAKRIEQPIVYDIFNDSTLYMFIDESGIRAVHTEKDDHSVYVNKIIQYWFTNTIPRLQIALCGQDKTSYVQIDEQRNVCISEEATWFDPGHTGDDDVFKTNGYCLAFDRARERFVIVRTCDNQQTIGTFRGYRLNTGYDAPDRAYVLGNTPEAMEMEVGETPCIPNTCDSAIWSQEI